MSNKMDEMKKLMQEKKKEGKRPASAKDSLQDKLANATAAMKEPVERKGTRAKQSLASQFITDHKVVSGDTLSGLAQKYYGTAVREKWMAIYEANKETIGDNPNLIRVGQVLKIPTLD